jgi:hypothetical protein
MNMPPTRPTVGCDAVVSWHPDCPATSRPPATRQPARRAAADLLLVFATAALALGLAAVTASLAPSIDEMGDPIQRRPRTGVSRAASLAAPPPVAGRDQAPLGTPMKLAGASVLADVVQFNAAGPWNSPLYPQNGVTLWDRIRVSSKRDRSAFLFGISIQLHAPETAATPGPPPHHLANSSHPKTTTGTPSCGELVSSPSLAMAACAAPAIGEQSPGPDLVRP